MRRRAVAALAALAACTTPPPAPTLDGSFLGAFSFTGTLVVPGQDAGGAPQTSCPIDLDAGFTAPPATLSFYAYLSQTPAAGAVAWQILGGPVETGVLDGGAFAVAVESCGVLTGCGCVASVTEQVALQAWLSDGGAAPALVVPVLLLSGWVEDTLSTSAGACLDAGASQVCLADAGPGCGLGPEGVCSVVYTVTGVPGLPGS